jgi:hypothetical protein
MREVTRLLHLMQRAPSEAARHELFNHVFELVYGDLRRNARRVFAGERARARAFRNVRHRSLIETRSHERPGINSARYADRVKVASADATSGRARHGTGSHSFVLYFVAGSERRYASQVPSAWSFEIVGGSVTREGER